MAPNNQDIQNPLSRLDPNPANDTLIEFENLCVYIITVFDSGLEFYKDKDRKLKIISAFEKKLSSYSKVIRDIKTQDRKVDQKIYDCEFANKNKDHEPFEIHFNIDTKGFEDSLLSEETQNLLSTVKTFNDVPAMLMMESYGIGILRTKWEFTGTKVDLDKAIDIAYFLIDDIDKNLFTNFFRPNIIRDIFPTSKRFFGFEYLKESLTEVIFISRDNASGYIKLLGKKEFYRQIAQMLWLYPSNLQMDEQFYEAAEKQNVSLLKRNVFIISRPASIGVFHDTEDIYVDRRINLLETLYCQYFLLKRFDYELSEIIYPSDPYVHTDYRVLRQNVDAIIAIQKEQQVLTEFYRNSHIASYAEYRLFLDAGNKAFSLSRLYDSVKERVEHSQAIVMEKLNQIRNGTLDLLQWAALGFAAIALSKDILNPLVLDVVLQHADDKVAKFQKDFPAWNALLTLGLTIVVMVIVSSFVMKRDIFKQLDEVEDQWRQGTLTQQEYERKRAEILEPSSRVQRRCFNAVSHMRRYYKNS